MVHRLEPLIGEQAGRVWAGTFHHIGNRLLRRAGATAGLPAELHASSTARTSSTSIRLAMDDATLTGTSGKMGAPGLPRYST